MDDQQSVGSMGKPFAESDALLVAGHFTGPCIERDRRGRMHGAVVYVLMGWEKEMTKKVCIFS